MIGVVILFSALLGLLGIVDSQLECEPSHVKLIQEYLHQALTQVRLQLFNLCLEFRLHSALQKVYLILRLSHGLNQCRKIAPDPQLVHVLVVLENELIEVTLLALNYLLLNHLAVSLHLRFELNIAFFDALNQVVVGEELQLSHVLLNLVVFLEIIIEL